MNSMPTAALFQSTQPLSFGSLAVPKFIPLLVAMAWHSDSVGSR
jgi:hypothetical protein